MSDIVDELAQYLQANAMGTVGTNIFEGRLPSDVDAAIMIKRTTGFTPDIYLPTKSPGIQVIVRDIDYDNAQAVFDSVRTLLHNQYNRTFISGGTFFYYLRLVSDGGPIGQDDNGRDLFSMNFEGLIR